MSTYDVIAELCKKENIAVTALEKELGFGRGSIGKLRTRSTTVERLQKIADYFNVSVEYLATGDDVSMTTYEIYQELLKQNGVKNADIARVTGISNATLSDWKMGKSVPKSDKLQKIADYFGVSITYLMTGKDESSKESQLNPKDEKDIQQILSNTEQLLKQDGLMFDGKPATPEAIESILSAMQIGMEMAKKKNKEKYTPKKYKKE